MNNKNKAVLVFGSVQGKNHKKMSEVLCSRNNGKGIFSEIIITTPGFFKSSDPEEVARIFSKKCVKTSLLALPEEAFGKASEISFQNSLPILITGSFFTASLAAEYYKIHL
jgi:dihydrofolate synthase/folylpolyglutamate synthase